MVCPVIAIDPKGVNKVDRLIAVSSLFESGMVYLPNVAPWLLDYELELTIFLLAPHDDQVDSTSQFLSWAHSHNASFDFASTGQKRVGSVAYDLDEQNDPIHEEHAYGVLKGNTDFRGY